VAGRLYGEPRSVDCALLYREARDSSPDLRRQLEALKGLANVCSCDPEDVAHARARLFRDHEPVDDRD
jgi:hypothetical protein